MILFFLLPRRIFNSILAPIFPGLLLNFNFLMAFNYSRTYLILPLSVALSSSLSSYLPFFILGCQPSSTLILISFNSKTILSSKILQLLFSLVDAFLLCFRFIVHYHLHYTLHFIRKSLHILLSLETGTVL
jgi:hypothetical protein